MSTYSLIVNLLRTCLLLIPAVAGADAALDPITPRLVNADAARGEKIFLQCRACHEASPDGRYTVGPNLWGVVGRPLASQPDYPYTDSLKSIGGTWDYETLSRYLFDPKAMAPAGRMAFSGIKRAEERAHLLAYLRTLSDTPVALPGSPAPSDAPAYGGLPAGDGREAVYFTCRACHSLDQFTGERMKREEWDRLIVTMVEKNGMETPEAWARRLMLDYLGSYFGVPQADDWQGLPPGPGREEVFYTCKACHSLMLVKQQGMNRENWDETLEWMVEEQGMDEIDDQAMRDRILDYLALHYGSER